MARRNAATRKTRNAFILHTLYLSPAGFGKQLTIHAQCSSNLPMHHLRCRSPFDFLA